MDLLIPYIESTQLAILPDLAHALQVKKLSLMLYDPLSDWFTFYTNERILLEAAALLHDSGWLIDGHKHHKHSLAYILNLDLPISHRQKIIIANIARYHRKSLPKLSHPHFAELFPFERETVIRLSAILRIADALDSTHKQIVNQLILQKEKNKIQLILDTKGAPYLTEEEKLHKKKELFESTFNDIVLI